VAHQDAGPLKCPNLQRFPALPQPVPCPTCMKHQTPKGQLPCYGAKQGMGTYKAPSWLVSCATEPANATDNAGGVLHCREGSDATTHASVKGTKLCA
jgi:hypothetical protein